MIASGASRPTRLPVLGLVVILVLAAVLRLVRLGANPFAQDELYTIIESTKLWHSPLQPGIGARPLYFLLEHALFNVLPQSAVGLRAPAFVFGLLGVWLTWAGARAVFGEVAAVVAALLLAISPWHMFASGMARYWSLVYVFAAGGCVALHQAHERDEPKWYAAALGSWALGFATHPTVTFPFVGVALAVSVVRPDGRLAWRWPTRAGWTRFWVPLAALVALGYGALALSGHSSALRNFGGRGHLATLRLLPAMIQWLTPEMSALAGLSAVVLACDRTGSTRRWGMMTLLGAASGITALALASGVTDVYADYGMALLPLLFVSSGGAAQYAYDRLTSRRRVLVVAACGVAMAGVLPETASHLSDGTRFDYRPAFRFVASEGPGLKTLVWPLIVQRYYAPDLNAEELVPNPASLDSALARERDLWVVVSAQRYGLVLDDSGVLRAWLMTHCRPRFTYERPRLDYRVYRVEVHRCASGQP